MGDQIGKVLAFILLCHFNNDLTFKIIIKLVIDYY
jgi:hypothetical protein